MNEIYAGIDYSINSPAICILRDNKYQWVSHPVANKTKKDRAMQEELAMLHDVTYGLQTLKLEFDCYENSDLAKMVKYELQADNLFDLFKTTLPSKFDKISIAIEGYSYGSRFSRTDSIIELAISTTLFKRLVLKKLYTENDVYKVYAPGTIKKTAGKGNYKKRELFDVFIENRLEDPILEQTPFFLFCKTLTVGKKVPAPIDDMIDAYFVLKTLIDKES